MPTSLRTTTRRRKAVQHRATREGLPLPLGLGTWAQLDLLDLGGRFSPRFLPAGAGEVVVLHYNGLAPIKGQDKYTIPFSEAWLLVGALQAVASHDDRVQINRAIAISVS